MTQRETPMTTLQHVTDLDFAADTRSAGAGTWPRWLAKIMGCARRQARRERAAPVPIYRITRVDPDRWVVERPSASIEHAFSGPEEAVAFIRRDCLYRPENACSIEADGR